MKRRTVFLLLLGGLTFVVSTDRAGGISVGASHHRFEQRIDEPKTQLNDHLEQKIAAFMRNYAVPGMAIVCYAHGKSYVLHRGYADKRTHLPVTNTTLFEVGSITKLFTSLLVAQEVLAGRLCLSESVRTYIPALAANRCLQSVTLERLATHTAMLPFNVPEHISSKDKFITYLAHWNPSSWVSLPYTYSNAGIELLRCVLEEKTHTSFQQLVVSRILRPLGMAGVGVQLAPCHAARCARCYDKVGHAAPLWHNRLLLGAAALRASSADMLLFLKAAIGLPGTPEQILNAMRLTQTPHMHLHAFDIGLCWYISNLARRSAKKTYKKLFQKDRAQRVPYAARMFTRNVLCEKTGTTEGFHAYIAVMPQRQQGVVIMMNRTLPKGWQVISKFGRELLCAL